MRNHQVQEIIDYSYGQLEPSYSYDSFARQPHFTINCEILKDYHFKMENLRDYPTVTNHLSLGEALQTLSTINFQDKIGTDINATSDDQNQNMEIQSHNEHTLHITLPTPRKSMKKLKICKKSEKNQYDKNIFANISKTIIKRMISGDYQGELRDNCHILEVDYSIFVSTFVEMDRQFKRMGTSELNHFMHGSNFQEGFKKVFYYFFVRFLKQEYLSYVINFGKMRQKEKYIKYASKMMYIPQLTRREYQFIFRSSQSHSL